MTSVTPSAPVRNNGTIRWRSKEVFITDVLRSQGVGLLWGFYLGMLDGKNATSAPMLALYPISDPAVCRSTSAEHCFRLADPRTIREVLAVRRDLHSWLGGHDEVGQSRAART
ncbi:MAG: hypothetical protein JO033_24405 [Acidobacteriaceae bacterium]|nr:hypothetical protein [Acidobacteriaceae bacterium]